MKVLNYPKISIITPSYNQGKYIEQTIISVLEQKYPNLEFIIIDGGSTDNTIQIIKKYEKYLTYWVSEKDMGQSNAINKGIAKVSGEIINWLNSDDYYMPGALHHVATKFSDSNVTAYCGRSRVFSENSEKISAGTDLFIGNLAKTIGWARIDQPETFFHKSVWDKVGLLNEGFHYVMDKEWWVRYLFHFGLNGITQDDKILVNFRIHDQSKTGSQLKKFEEETDHLFYSLSLLKNVKHVEQFPYSKAKQKLLQGYPPIDNALLDNVINYYFLHAMLESYAQNDYKKAKAFQRKIDVKKLNDLDKIDFFKVMKRMNILPVGLKKFYNKFF